MDRELDVLQSMGLQRVGHNWATELNRLVIWLLDFLKMQGGHHTIQNIISNNGEQTSLSTPWLLLLNYSKCGGGLQGAQNKGGYRLPCDSESSKHQCFQPKQHFCSAVGLVSWLGRVQVVTKRKPKPVLLISEFGDPFIDTSLKCAALWQFKDSPNHGGVPGSTSRRTKDYRSEQLARSTFSLTRTKIPFQKRTAKLFHRNICSCTRLNLHYIERSLCRICLLM